MSTPITADQLLAQLKKWKVPYREIDGWRTRGRDAFTGLTFGPVFGCVTHHTGDDAPDSADRNVIINGRSDLPGPLAQFGLNDDGVVDLISVNRCNHAGGGDPRVLEAVKAESYADYPPASRYHQGSPGSTDGNDCFYGVETYYSGGKAPTAAAYKTLVLLWAALCDFHEWSAKSVIGHKEWSDWKSDPGHVDMKVLRADVQKALDVAHAPKPTLFPIKHRIATANLFVKNKDQSGGLVRLNARVKQAFGWGPDVIGVQEGRDVSVVGYQTFVADKGEAAREIPVLLRSHLKCLGVEYHHAADGLPEMGGVYAHPRGIFVVKYLKRRRKVAVVNTHMGIFGEERAATGHPGPAGEQHAEHAHLVVRIVQRLRRNGYVVHVTADANSRGLWVESLPAVLAELGMTVTRHGVDMIASDPKRVRRSVDVAIIPHAVTGSDVHDGIAIRSTERKAR